VNEITVFVPISDFLITNLLVVNWFLAGTVVTAAFGVAFLVAINNKY
jgi:hypothetical protein